MKLIEKIRALPTPIFVLLFIFFAPIIIPIGLIYIGFRGDRNIPPELRELRKIRKELEKQNSTNDSLGIDDKDASPNDSRK